MGVTPVTVPPSWHTRAVLSYPTAVPIRVPSTGDGREPENRAGGLGGRTPRFRSRAQAPAPARTGKLLDKVKQVIVYTDMLDELGELRELELHRVAIGVDPERFRAKAREYCETTWTKSPCRRRAATVS